MKKIVVLLVILSCSASLLFAGSDWGIFAAYWDTSDGEESVGPGIKFGLEMIEGVQLEIRGTFFDNVIDDNAADTDLQVIPLEAGLALDVPISDSALFYAGGGFSYFLLDGDSGGVAGYDPDNELGYYLVAGTELTVRERGAFYGETEAAFFAEVLYRAVEVDGVGGGDVDLDGLGFNGGLLIKW